MPKQLVIFDADGTLADTNHQFVSAYQEAFSGMKQNVDPKLLLSLIGMGHDQAIPLLTSVDWHKAHGDELAERAERIYLDTYLTRSTLFPGAVDLLTELKAQGFSLALASSSQRVIINHYLTLITNAADLFSAVVTFDDVTRSKPDPELFLKVLEVTKMDPKNTCAVGDSEWDMQACGAAQIDAIAVLSGGTPKKKLKKYAP